VKIIRKYLHAEQVYPANMRYNPDTGGVEITPDGENWYPAPDADPRLNNPYPTIATENPRCDAAARMVALLQEMEASYEANLNAASAAAEFTTAILLLLAFIPFIGVLAAVMSGLALQLIPIGYATLHAAFDGFDWDGLTCQFYGVLSDFGVLDDAGLTAIRGVIDADYTATQSLTLLGFLDILGYGGLNAAASLRTETGDCESCSPTGWEWDFTGGDNTGVGIILTYGLWVGDGFISRVQGNGDSWLKISVQGFSNKYISRIEVEAFADVATVASFYVACPGEVSVGSDNSGVAHTWQVLGVDIGSGITCGVRAVEALSGAHYMKFRRLRVFCTSFTGFTGGHPYYLPGGILGS